MSADGSDSGCDDDSGEQAESDTQRQKALMRQLEEGARGTAFLLSAEGADVLAALLDPRGPLAYAADLRSAVPAENELPRLEYGELIRNIPGVDPVIAMHEGAQVPTGGWVVQAVMEPGTEGVLEISRFDEGLRLRKSGDSAEDPRLAVAEGRGICYFVACEPPNYPDRQVDPHSRGLKRYMPIGYSDGIDIHDVSGERRLLEQSAPIFGNLYCNLKASDLDGSDWIRDAAYVSRLIDRAEDLPGALACFGTVLGLTAVEAAGFADRVARKITSEAG